MPWAAQALWAIAVVACGALALFAASLLVLGWSAFSRRERIQLVLLVLLG
jgi:hypothetical protein